MGRILLITFLLMSEVCHIKNEKRNEIENHWKTSLTDKQYGHQQAGDLAAMSVKLFFYHCNLETVKKGISEHGGTFQFIS